MRDKRCPVLGDARCVAGRSPAPADAFFSKRVLGHIMAEGNGKRLADGQVSMRVKVFRWLFLVFGLILLAGVCLQVLLAGIGVMTARGFGMHAEFGHFLEPVALLLAIFGFFTGTRWPLKVMAPAVLVLIIAQSLFIALRDNGFPDVAALHAVNALAIFGLSLEMVRRTLPLMKWNAVPTSQAGRLPTPPTTP